MENNDIFILKNYMMPIESWPEPSSKNTKIASYYIYWVLLLMKFCIILLMKIIIL